LTARASSDSIRVIGRQSVDAKISRSNGRREAPAGPAVRAGRAERLQRILDVLAHVVRHPEGRTLTEIQRALSLPVSSTHDILRAMTDAGFLAVSEDRRWNVGPRLVTLSFAVVDSMGIARIARPYLIQLVDAVEHDVYLAHRIGRKVVYVDRIPGLHPVTVDIKLGRPLFLHSTAVGKLYAAFDDEVREDLWSREHLPRPTPSTITRRSDLETELRKIRDFGVSLSLGESIEGITGLAVPVIDGHRILAAVHVSALSGQMPEDRIPGVLDEMRATCRRIESALGVSDSQAQRKGPFPPRAIGAP
jgi:DNA-binding IclR family transcriptional regulator